jgi:hypothetical protein
MMEIGSDDHWQENLVTGTMATAARTTTAVVGHMDSRTRRSYFGVLADALDNYWDNYCLARVGRLDAVPIAGSSWQTT